MSLALGVNILNNGFKFCSKMFRLKILKVRLIMKNMGRGKEIKNFI